MTEKEKNLYQGELKNYNSDEQDKMRKDILQYIKEKGLTVSQATDLLTCVINMMSDYATLISIADYEKLTGRDVFANIDSEDVNITGNIKNFKCYLNKCLILLGFPALDFLSYHTFLSIPHKFLEIFPNWMK